MSSESSSGSSTSRIRQFGLYRSIDSRTEEFLRLSMRRQIRQGCACAAVSTAITITVVVVVIIVYEFNLNSEINLEGPIKANWLNLMNVTSESQTFDSTFPKDVNQGTLRFLPMLIKTYKKNVLTEKVNDDPNSNPLYDKKFTIVDDYYKKSIFTRNWLKLPTSKLFTIEYKTSPVVYYRTPTENIKYFTKIRKIRDDQRIIDYVDKMINVKSSIGPTKSMIKEHVFTVPDATPTKPDLNTKQMTRPIATTPKNKDNFKKTLKSNTTNNSVLSVIEASPKKLDVNIKQTHRPSETTAKNGNLLTKGLKPNTCNQSNQKPLYNKMTEDGTKVFKCKCPHNMGTLLKKILKTMQNTVPQRTTMLPIKQVTKESVSKELDQGDTKITKQITTSKPTKIPTPTIDNDLPVFFLNSLYHKNYNSDKTNEVIPRPISKSETSSSFTEKHIETDTKKTIAKELLKKAVAITTETMEILLKKLLTSITSTITENTQQVPNETVSKILAHTKLETSTQITNPTMKKPSRLPVPIKSLLNYFNMTEQKNPTTTSLQLLEGTDPDDIIIPKMTKPMYRYQNPRYLKKDNDDIMVDKLNPKKRLIITGNDLEIKTNTKYNTQMKQKYTSRNKNSISDFNYDATEVPRNFLTDLNNALYKLIEQNIKRLTPTLGTELPVTFPNPWFHENYNWDKTTAIPTDSSQAITMPDLSEAITVPTDSSEAITVPTDSSETMNRPTDSPEIITMHTVSSELPTTTSTEKYIKTDTENNFGKEEFENTVVTTTKQVAQKFSPSSLISSLTSPFALPSTTTLVSPLATSFKINNLTIPLAPKAKTTTAPISELEKINWEELKIQNVPAWKSMLPMARPLYLEIHRNDIKHQEDPSDFEYDMNNVVYDII